MEVIIILDIDNITIGDWPTQISCYHQLLGNDILIVITGGTHPHAGAVALGIPRQSLSDPNSISATVSVLTRTGHKDDEIARMVAQEIASFFNRNVVVIAGIHIDNASIEQIECFISYAKTLNVWLKKNIKPSTTAKYNTELLKDNDIS